MLAAGGRVQRVLAITIAMVGALGALAVAPTSATAADADPDPAIAPVDPVIASGDELVVEVSIGSTTPDDLDVDVLVGGRAIATRTAFSQWIEGTASPSLATVATATIPGGQSRVEVTVPADDLPWSAATSGAMLLAADVEGVDERLRSLVTLDLPESGPTRVAFTLPTTTPETESGLLTAEELEAAVADGGTLAAQLAVGEAGATLGLDPIVPASIAALGDDAPEDAVAWLEAASALPQTYALPFGGADPVAIARSGTAIPGIVGIPATDDDGEPIVQPAALAQVPTTTAPVVDATDAAVDGTLLSALAASATVILDTDDLDETLDRITPDAHATVAGADVLVADAELQQLVRTAVTAGGTAAADARSRALALLATVTREAPALQRTLVAALPADADPEAAQALLAEVAGTPWLEQTSIAQAYAEPARDAELVPTDASAEDRDAATRIAALVASAASAEAVGTTLVDPESLIAPVRLQLLAAIATTSRADDDAAVARFEELIAPLREPVAIVEGGDTTVLSPTADLQITLENRLDADVTVELVARTGTNAVTLPPEPIEVDVAAGSRVRVPVSVDVVAAGSGVIRLEVRTPEGVALDTATLRITTQPAFETILLVVVGLAAALLLGFGIFRSIRKRRAGTARGDIDPRTEQLAVADARDAASAKRQTQHDDAPGGRG